MFKIIEIQNPYDCFGIKGFEEAYNRALALKISSYKESFGYGAFPLDEFDYFSNHYLVSDKKGQILAAYRITTSNTCKRFKRDFILYPILEYNKAKLHIESLSQMIDMNQFRDFGYISAYAMDRNVSEEVRYELLHLYNSMIYFYCNENKSKKTFVIGIKQDDDNPSKKVNTIKVFKRLGFQAFLDCNNDELPSFIYKRLELPEAKMFMSPEVFPSKIEKRAQEHRSLWEERHIIVGGKVLEKAA